MKKNPPSSLPTPNSSVLKSPPDEREPPIDPRTVRAKTLSRRHLRFGWWGLVGYLSFGIFLEVVHGLKGGWYLDVGNETRRLMFTLAHAHGTLLALINLVVGLSLRLVPAARLSTSASLSLAWAGLILPLGFFLGGVVTYGGDPGLGIVLVPVGGLLLLYGVIGAARAFTAKEGG